mgnify:CR=1 FL=1
MAIDKNLYTENSIESLSPLEFTRLRPGVYAGDTTYSTQLLIEIVSNAVDEFRLGHGKCIEVTLKGPAVRVRDYGQGFLVNSIRDDGKTVLEDKAVLIGEDGKIKKIASKEELTKEAPYADPGNRPRLRHHGLRSD